jgi:hypothetical protein
MEAFTTVTFSAEDIKTLIINCLSQRYKMDVTSEKIEFKTKIVHGGSQFEPTVSAQLECAQVKTALK